MMKRIPELEHSLLEQSESLLYQRVCRGRARMVVEFITTYAISAVAY